MKNKFPSSERSVEKMSRNIVGCALALLLTSIPLVQGIGAQVDQENWDLTPTFTFSVVQQEFTPAFDSLDSAQLVLSNMGAMGWPGGPTVRSG